MEITRLVYLGPQAVKTVSGVGEFIKDRPMDVDPNRARSILRYWPNQFAIVIPCPICSNKQEIVLPPINEPAPIEDNPDPIEKPRRGRKKTEE